MKGSEALAYNHSLENLENLENVVLSGEASHRATVWVRFHLHERSRISKSAETESKCVIKHRWGSGQRGSISWSALP